MTAFHDMTDQELAAAARRCTSPTYRPLADRIDKRSAEVVQLVASLQRLILPRPDASDVVRAVALLRALEDQGTMAALVRVKGL